MIESDLEFLKFRTELIELLSKYKYTISGTGYDDGSMEIEDIKEGKNYLLMDDASDYSTFRLNNEAIVDIVTEYILGMFPEQQHTKLSRTNAGVFTHSRYKAEQFLDNLFQANRELVEQYKKSKDEIVLLLKDGSRYTWIKPTNSSRGYKCSKAYIDKNLTLNELNKIVFPICIYCARGDVLVI